MRRASLIAVCALATAFSLGTAALPAAGDPSPPSSGDSAPSGSPAPSPSVSPTAPPVPPSPPAFLPAPVAVSGDFMVGGSLTATVGSFGEVEPVKLVYTWYRDATPIAKAHDPVYLVRPADAGHLVTASVRAERDGVTPLTVSSQPSPAIAPGTMTVGTVRIAGSPRVGVELEAKPSGFGPLKPTRYSFQWLRSGKPIAGATSRTYTVTDKDTHKRLSVRVTASRRSFTDATTASAKTKKVPKRPKWVDPRCMTGKVICIDMNPKDRKVRWVVNGKVKMTFAARFGSRDLPTRTGVYTVYMKSRDHYSTLYNSQMPYAMFFSGGQAVHYSPDFAARGYSGASHGCVNLRDPNGARKLFAKVSVGTKVVVYR